MAVLRPVQGIRIVQILLLGTVLVFATHGSAGTLAGVTPAEAIPPATEDSGTSSATAVESPSEPTGVITLPEVLTLALKQSPELRPFSWQVRADEARVLQARMWPNPRAEFVAEDVVGTGDFSGGDRAQYTLQLSQLIELGGKRAARTAVASRSTDVARGDYEVRRVEVLADATERFINVLDRQAALALARTSADLSSTTAENVRRRARAGAGSDLETKKAQIALARARVMEEDAVHELAVARTRLAAAWGSSAPRFERAEGDLFSRTAVPSFAAVADRIPVSPEMLRWSSERRLRRAEVALANARRIPDLTVAAGPRRLEGGGESLVLGIAVPLPLFDRNQGGVAEAEALASRTEASAKAAEVRLQAVLFGLYQGLLHAGTELDMLEKRALSEAQAALTISRRGFTEGRFSFLDLLDAQRTFIDVRKEHLEAAARYHRFVLSIERLTGEPIDGSSTTPVPRPEHPGAP